MPVRDSSFILPAGRVSSLRGLAMGSGALRVAGTLVVVRQRLVRGRVPGVFLEDAV